MGIFKKNLGEKPKSHRTTRGNKKAEQKMDISSASMIHWALATTRTLGMRELMVVLLLFSLLPWFSIGRIAPVYAEGTGVTMVFTLNDTIYTVNGEPRDMEVGPVSVDGRTMLPVVYVAKPLQATTAWDNASKKVTVTLGDTKLEMWIGQSKARRNGEPVSIDPQNSDVRPLIINGRTMLPMRFVAENLGCHVDWNSATKCITITQKGSATGGGQTTPPTTTPTTTAPPVTPPVEVKPPEPTAEEIKAKEEADKALAEAEKAKKEAEKAKAEAEKAKAEAEKAKAEAEKAKEGETEPQIKLPINPNWRDKIKTPGDIIIDPDQIKKP